MSSIASCCRIAVSLSVAILPLVGCADSRGKMREFEAQSVSALWLDQDLLAKSNDSTKWAGDANLRSTIKHSLLQDSMKKCWAFTGALGATERTIDTGFDIATTSMAALGAVFTPLNTVRALSAAAAISSGTKGAIDADVYAKQTGPLIVNSILATYWKDITAYRDNSAKGAAGKMFADADPSEAASTITAYHVQCGLDAALGHLNVQLGGYDPFSSTKTSYVAMKDIKDAATSLDSSAIGQLTTAKKSLTDLVTATSGLDKAKSDAVVAGINNAIAIIEANKKLKESSTPPQ